VNRSRSTDRRTSTGATRAERRASERRNRALSHLERVRGEIPQQRGGRKIYVPSAAIAVLIGAFFGASLVEDDGRFAPDSQIDSISVRGATHLDAAEIAEASGVPRNAALAAVDSEAVALRLTEHQWIARARTLRLPTGTLLVSVSERTPAGRVIDPSSALVHLVDTEGTPFAIATETEGEALPLVRVPNALEKEGANADVARALALADSMRRFGLPESREITISPADDPTGFTLQLAGVIPRVILGWEDLEPKLRELAKLLAAELPEFTDASELDLRFAGQGILRNDPLPEGAEQAAVSRGFAPPST